MRNKKAKVNEVSEFEAAVKDTILIANAYCKGLKAMGKYSIKVKLNNPRLCEGSVDIDAALSKYVSEENRWDYCLSYDGEILFVEVHSASTGEVKAVLKKLRWLLNWLEKEAPKLNKLSEKSKHPFYWIQTNGFHILPGSQQYRQAILNKIKPISRLEL